MQDMIILIDSVYYVVPPRAQTTRDGDQLCRPAMFLAEQLTVTMLGQKFMENFVTSYDYSNGKVDLALSAHAHQGTTLKNIAEQGQDQPEPTEPPEEEPVITPVEPEPTDPE